MTLTLSIVLCTLCISMLIRPAALLQTVFGSATDGKFWGVKMDPNAATVKFDLYKGYKPEPEVGAISCDEYSRQCLFDQFNPHALRYGPLCTPGVDAQFLVKVTDVILEVPEYGDALVGKVSAFALHKSKIYFLHNGMYSGESTVHTFQIRVMQSCEECNVDPYEKDETQTSSMSMKYTVKCSKIVAKLNSIIDTDSEYEFYLGSVLKVIGDNEEDLTFYFQLARYSFDSNEKVLLMYKVDTNSNVELIHTQVTSSVIPLSLRLIGGVDYKDGVLCWTAGDRALCKFKANSKPKIIVKAGGAIGPCGGTDAKRLNDISGIAIIEAGGGERTVVFGCSAETPNVTGAGIVRIHPNETVISINPFKAQDEFLTAGNILNIKELKEDCSFTPRPQLCVPLERTSTESVPQIPTLPTTTEGAEQNAKTDANIGEENIEQGETDPSGETGATEEDKIVDDGTAIVGTDPSNSAPCEQSVVKHMLLCLSAMVSACILLS